jgi:hypothetical protein
MSKIDRERIAFERSNFDHFITPAMEFEDLAGRASRPHQNIAHGNVLDGLERAIEHQDQGPGGVTPGGRHAQRVAGTTELEARGAHQRGVVAMVRRDGRPDLVLVITAGIGADIDAGDELYAVQIGETADAPCGLRFRRHVLVGNPTRRVQHAAH